MQFPIGITILSLLDNWKDIFHSICDKKCNAKVKNFESTFISIYLFFFILYKCNHIFKKYISVILFQFHSKDMQKHLFGMTVNIFKLLKL